MIIYSSPCSLKNKTFVYMNNEYKIMGSYPGHVIISRKTDGKVLVVNFQDFITKFRKVN